MSGNKQQRATGFEVMMDRFGNVHQAAIPSDPLSRHRPIDVVERTPVECVVEALYYTDQDDRNGHTKQNQRTAMVDVRTLGKRSQQLRWVPVLQRTQGLWDEDIYLPRPSKLDIDGNQLSVGSAAKGDSKPTAAESMDGDRGLVLFLENDPARPVFLPYSQGHPKTNTPRAAADGRVRRIRHAGVLMEWSEDGNWTLDATNAALQELGAGGVEQPNSGTTGVVTLKTKNGSGAELHLILDETGKATLQAPDIRIGTAFSDEPMVLGEQWIAIMDELLTALVSLTVGTGVGPSTTPINFAAFEAIRAKIVTQRLHVSDFIFGKKEWP